jgi:hypothetical protein
VDLGEPALESYLQRVAETNGSGFAEKVRSVLNGVLGFAVETAS